MDALHALLWPYLAKKAGGLPVAGTVHVTPVDDAVGHDTSTDEPDCACGPEVRPVQSPDGSTGWLIVHASLDGREQYETQTTSRPSGGLSLEEGRMNRWTTGAFWSDTFERAVRTAAQAALGVIGADTVGLLDVSWGVASSVAGLAAVVSLLTSVVAGGTGDPATAGFVTQKR